MSGRFSDWQERTQNLRTHTISVFLGISLATIGFVLSRISDDSFKMLNTAAKTFFIFAGIFLVAHVVVSLVLMLNRLEGFRTTTKIVRKKDTHDLSNIEEMRDKSLDIDRRTHCLFISSVVIFALAEALTAVAFVIQIAPKFQ